MSDQTLDNERGAERAEELRKRFKKVSAASLGQSASRNPFSMDPVRRPGPSRYNSSSKALGVWLVVALLVMAATLFL